MYLSGAANFIILFQMEPEVQAEGCGSSLGLVFPGATYYGDEDPHRDVAQAHSPVPEACPDLHMNMQLPCGRCRSSSLDGTSIGPLPEEGTGPRCFLPRTSFKQMGGGRPSLQNFYFRLKPALPHTPIS